MNNTLPMDEPSSNIIKFQFKSQGFSLAEEPALEELALDWTLSDEDKKMIYKLRGDDNLRRCAVQLCVLRKYGRFLDDYSSVSTKTTGYISQQLEIEPTLMVLPSGREKTEEENRKSVREYLSCSSFDSESQNELEEYILRIALNDFYPDDLLLKTEQFLKKNKIVLPLPKSMEDIVNAVYAKVEKKIFDQIAGQIPDEVKEAIDNLLQTPEKSNKTEFFKLDDYPPEATPRNIAEYLRRYDQLNATGIDNVRFKGISKELLIKLNQVTRSYSAWQIKRFENSKRYAVSAAYLYELKKTFLDNLVYMNRRYLTDMQRESRKEYEEKHKKARRKLRTGVVMLVDIVRKIVTARRNNQDSEEFFKQKVNTEVLETAVENCNNFILLEDTGYLEELSRRYNNFRRYFPGFLTLDFHAEHGSEYLLEAIAVARRMNAEGLKSVPGHAPFQFVPAGWQKMLRSKDDKIVKRTWEISLALSIKDALKSGSLFLPESRAHMSFWELVYNDQKWIEEKEKAYAQLNLTPDSNEFLTNLKDEFNQIASVTCGRVHDNPFVKIKKNGDVRFRQDDSLKDPPEIKKLRQLIISKIPKIRIEKLVKEVDTLCNFTDELKPVDGRILNIENYHPTLRCAVTAHGTNVGIYTMGNSNKKITIDMLQYISNLCLRNRSIKKSNTKLVNFINNLKTSINLGSDMMSSSDGQRFGVQGSCLIASFYPRYFGYYDKVVTIYTHVSKCSVFGTYVISCGDRESWFVLNGLLDNDTELTLGQHHTDTHGSSDHIFALCCLLGVSFMPRLKKLHKQALYKIDKNMHYGPLEPMFKGTIDMELIAEQWDQMIRVTAALKNRIISAHVIAQRLAASSSLDRLAKAFTELGKLVKTIYLLGYIDNEPIRRQVQRMLCYGEQRQGLVKHVFFANQGMFRQGDLEEIMNKASCLSLLSNAIVCWNTVQVERIVKDLREKGHEIQDEHLARIYPLFYEHVIVNGEYDFS